MKILTGKWNFVNLLRYAKMISQTTLSFPMKLISGFIGMFINAGDT